MSRILAVRYRSNICDITRSNYLLYNSGLKVYQLKMKSFTLLWVDFIYYMLINIGYRHDTETELYYLQSRYYNPELERFINADAIAGSVGELLSHSIFAYCKNNPINGRESFGFRPAFADEETQQEYDNWVQVQHQALVNGPSQQNNNKITKEEAISIGKSMAKNAGTGYGEYLATHLSKPKK